MNKDEQKEPEYSEKKESRDSIVKLEEIKSEIKEDLVKHFNKKPQKESLLTIFWKLSYIGTLLFLIISYFYSVKPVFDKYDELNSKQNTIDNLTEQINLKQTDLADFSEKNEELKQENSILENKIDNQNQIFIQYSRKLTETENLLNAAQKERQTAEKSAIMLHLKKFISDIFPYEYTNKNESNYDIKQYVLNYVEVEKEDMKEDLYGIKALEILEKYTKYENSYGIENSIYFLTVYYQLVYLK
jgi:DNA repair exonuclease SbcCD ATPase subunit